MNALVLGLLLLWAPREWALIGPSRLSLLRLSLTSAVPAEIYVIVLAPRLPDPLGVDAAVCFRVLVVVAIGWLFLHGVLAVAFRLPGTGALRMRLGRTGVAVTLALLAASVTPAPARALAVGAWSAGSCGLRASCKALAGASLGRKRLFVIRKKSSLTRRGSAAYLQTNVDATAPDEPDRGALMVRSAWVVLALMLLIPGIAQAQQPVVHAVVDGETLWGLAQCYYLMIPGGGTASTRPTGESWRTHSASIRGSSW